MIISPPFLPDAGLTGADTDPDPMTTAVDRFEQTYHGCFPVTFDRRWHCGIHLVPDTQGEPVRAIADGEVVAYRISQDPISDGHTDDAGHEVPNTNDGFVLLRHTTDTGDGRTITYYSLYMHLLDLTAQATLIHPQPANPPQNTSPGALAAWLLQAGGVTAGNRKNVYRKDILGYRGQSQGLRHLHFEIFMTEQDFAAWFQQSGHTVQLGEKDPVQPTSKDWWGHAYYVIPGSVEFLDAPSDVHDPQYFPALSRGKLPKESSKLYVEAYFHKGQRYTRSWLDENGDGELVLLTQGPVKDKYTDYEYNLYERAVKLYPTCPSDGYDLLRFGRILAEAPTLTSQNSATWVAVPFNNGGSQGYVDINKSGVIKLSDADFPYFTGWQKIDADNAPVGTDGLFSYNKLCQLLGNAPRPTSETAPSDPSSLNQQVTDYLRSSEGARVNLSGFVCHTKSEWDPANNSDRYQDLNKPDGYFGQLKSTDPNGYENFLSFVKKLQFLDQVPSLAGGNKFWFFHPLAFIRHFRKCGWLSKDEMIHCIRKTIRENGNEVVRVSHDELIARLTKATDKRPENLHPSFQVVARKYGISNSMLRLAHLFGQLTAETGRLEYMLEKGNVSYFDKYEPGTDQGTKLGNTMIGDGVRFKGRGLIQLTGRNNYDNYGAYRAKIFNTDSTSSLLLSDPYNTCDASGWYWASKQRYIMTRNSSSHKNKLSPLGSLGINSWADQGSSDNAILQVTKCINPAGAAFDWRAQGFRNAYFSLNDETLSHQDYLPVV